MFPFAFRLLALSLSFFLPLSQVPELLSHADPDEAVAHRYNEVIAKTHDGTVRAEDLGRLAVAVDLRNRHAAANRLDQNVDMELRARKLEIARHVITPIEARRLHAAHPDLPVEHILALNDRDRARDIDDFLASGGTRGFWRNELHMLTQESRRRAQLDLHPSFRLAQFSVEDDNLNGLNWDGFYGADPFYADNTSMTFCRIMEWIAIYAAILCYYGIPAECVAAIAMEAAAKLCGYIYGV